MKYDTSETGNFTFIYFIGSTGITPRSLMSRSESMRKSFLNNEIKSREEIREYESQLESDDIIEDEK